MQVPNIFGKCTCCYQTNSEINTGSDVYSRDFTIVLADIVICPTSAAADHESSIREIPVMRVRFAFGYRLTHTGEEPPDQNNVQTRPDTFKSNCNSDLKNGWPPFYQGNHIDQEGR